MLVGVIAEELLLPVAGRLPSVFIDSDIFPQATIYVPGFLLPGLSADGDVTYGIVVSNTGAPILYVSLVNDTDIIFDFTSSHADAIVPALFQSDDRFYQATTPAALGLQLLVDADRFYGPQTAFNLTSAAVTSDDAIRAQIFQYGTTWHTLSASVVDADLFIRPDVSWPVLSAALVDADAFYAPDLPHRLLPGALASGETFFSAAIGAQIRPAFVADTEQFFALSIPAPIVPVTLTADLAVDSDILIQPIIFIPGSGLVTALYSDTDVFFSPSATLAPLAPALFSDTDSFLGPTIRMFLLPGLLSDSETIAAPAIGAAPPTFVNATSTSGSTGATSLTSPLVTSRTTGNLLIALIQTQSGPKTFSVGGGWTIGGTQADTTMSSAWAWRYVDGTEAAPAFSWTTSAACHTKMFQFNNVASTSATGAFASTSATGTAVSQTGITTTLDSSLVLALLFARTAQTGVAGITLGSYSVTGTPFSDSFLTDIEGRTTVTASGSVSPTLAATLTVSSLWHSHLVEIKRL